jgi:hypothetical protein
MALERAAASACIAALPAAAKQLGFGEDTPWLRGQTAEQRKLAPWHANLCAVEGEGARGAVEQERTDDPAGLAAAREVELP